MFNCYTIYISLWRALALREGESWAQFKIRLGPVLERLDERYKFKPEQKLLRKEINCGKAV